MLEALNDYLLALRFMLEGGGPADLGLRDAGRGAVRRARARAEIKAVVDRAAGARARAVERRAVTLGGAEGAPTPAETAAAIEDLTRAILRDAACGHLGSDLRATADEILLADGLAVGEGEAEQRGGSEEWDLPDEDEDDDEDDRGRTTGSEPDDDDSEEAQDDLEEDVEVAPAGVRRARREPAAEEPVRPDGDSSGWTSPTSGRRDARSARTTMRCRFPSPRVESRSSHDPEPEEDHVFASSQPRREERQTTAIEAGERIHDRFNELLETRAARARGRWPTASPISSRVPRRPSGTCAR